MEAAAPMHSPREDAGNIARALKAALMAAAAPSYEEAMDGLELRSAEDAQLLFPHEATRTAQGGQAIETSIASSLRHSSSFESVPISLNRAEPICLKGYRKAAAVSFLREQAHHLRFEIQPPYQDVPTSARYYARAASLGCADSMAEFAMSHLFGVGVERDRDTTIRILQSAMQLGSIVAFEARALYAITYAADGNNTYSEALRYLAQGVARHSPSCYLWAGFCFEMGFGIKPDANAARAGYAVARRSETLSSTLRTAYPGALSAGDPWMLFKMALFFMHCGNGRWGDAAMRCLRQAAALGLNDAKVYLAVCHIQGKWIVTNVPVAVHWLYEACAGDNPHWIAKRMLRQYYRERNSDAS